MWIILTWIVIDSKKKKKKDFLELVWTAMLFLHIYLSVKHKHWTVCSVNMQNLSLHFVDTSYD